MIFLVTNQTVLHVFLTSNYSKSFNMISQNREKSMKISSLCIILSIICMLLDNKSDISGLSCQGQAVCETDRNSRNKMRPKIYRQYTICCNSMPRYISLDLSPRLQFHIIPFCCRGSLSFHEISTICQNIFGFENVLCCTTTAFNFSRHRIFPG